MGPTKDPAHLEEMWEGAVKIAIKHVPERVTAVVTEVVERLLQLGRNDKGARLFMAAGFNKEALKICIDHKLWALGEEAAQSLPDDLKDRLRQARAEAEGGAKPRGSLESDGPGWQAVGWKRMNAGGGACVRCLGGLGLQRLAAVLDSRTWQRAREEVLRLRVLYPLLAGSQVPHLPLLPPSLRACEVWRRGVRLRERAGGAQVGRRGAGPGRGCG